MTTEGLLLFRKWDLSEITINDIGLKTAISLKKNSIPNGFWAFCIKAIQ